MNVSRILVNCLAGLVGFFGASLAFGSLFVLGYFAFGQLPSGFGQAHKGIAIAYLVFTALSGVLGYFFLRQAWKHLRKPDLASAKNIVGDFSIVLGIFVFGRILRQFDLVTSHRAEDSILSLAVGLAVCVVVWAFHRFALKRTVTRAFPEGPATPPPLPTT